MNDTPSPFAPFQPGSPPTQPEMPATEAPKQKAAREKREAKAAAKANKAETFAEPRQKRRATGEPKTALKFDLQTILSAAAMLNADDQAAFEKVVGILSDAGKPGRERLLAAIGKIFE